LTPFVLFSPLIHSSFGWGLIKFNGFDVWINNLNFTILALEKLAAFKNWVLFCRVRLKVLDAFEVDKESISLASPVY
jgi:hypothetical protein